MPYAEGRIIHDADSHVMETPEWLLSYADPDIRERLEPLRLTGCKPGEETFIDELRRRHADPADRADAEAKLMTRKNWSAIGSFVKEDRPRALDLLGFRSQLVFNTFLSDHFVHYERARDAEFTYGAARAHNRAIVDFCSVDSRLLAVGFVPLSDIDRARAMAVEAIETGCKALLISSACPPGRSPSHVGWFPVWEVAEEAGLPIVFHVGGGGELLDPSYFENGLPPVPDFH